MRALVSLTGIVGYSKCARLRSDTYSSSVVIGYNAAVNSDVFIFVERSAAGPCDADTTITAVRPLSILDEDVFAIGNTKASKPIIVGVMNPPGVMGLFIRRD